MHLAVTLSLTITYLLTQVRVLTIVSVAGGSDRSPAQRPAARNCEGVFDSEAHLAVIFSLTITYLLTLGNCKEVFPIPKRTLQ
jgi:hypothetical protein